MKLSLLLPDPLRRAIRSNIVFISVFTVLVLQLLLKDLMLNNEQQVLANARHLLDPGWIPNDWFLQRDIGYRALFNWLVGPLTLVFPLDAVALAGRILVFLIFSLLVQRLARIFDIHPLLAVPMVFLFSINQSIVAHEWMLGPFETKCITYLCVIGALICFLNRRYALMFLLSGLAASFHVLIGLYAAITLGAAMLIRYRDLREDFPRIARSAPWFLLTAAPALLAVLSYLNNSSGADSRLAGYVYVVVRGPHHLFPGAWEGWWQVRLGLCIIFSLVVVLRSPDRRYRFLATYALAALGLFSVGLVLYYTGQYPLLKYYWFRFGDTMAPFILLLLAACLVSDYLRAGRAVGSAAADRPSRLRKGILIAAAVMTLAACTGSLLLFGLHLKVMGESSPYYLWKMDGELKKALLWIRSSTPRDSTVLTDPFIDTLYVTAERAQFVAFKHIPQDDRGIIEWYGRMLELNNGVEPANKGFTMQDEMKRSYYALDERTLTRLAKKYGIDYYLDKNGRSLPFTAVYRNKNYVLYSVTQE
jgi:hypothetical protein